MKSESIAVFLLSLMPLSILCAQQSDKIGEGVSSIQWVNGSGTPGIKLSINEKVVTDSWYAGANGGVGPKNSIKWSVSFSPPAPGLGFSETFTLQNRSSSVALLIGDFKQFTSDEIYSRFPQAGENVPPGFTKLAKAGFTRAALIRFPILKETSSEFPIYLVNGIPDSEIQIAIKDRGLIKLNYGKPETFTAPFGKRTEILIQESAYKEQAAIRPKPSYRGALLAFYRKPGKAQTEKVYVNLDSLESLEYRAANPEMEKEEED